MDIHDEINKTERIYDDEITLDLSIYCVMGFSGYY